MIRIQYTQRSKPNVLQSAIVDRYAVYTLNSEINLVLYFDNGTETWVSNIIQFEEV